MLASLAVTGLLFASDRFGWPGWHKGYAVLTCVASLSAVLVLMLLWFVVALIFRLRFQFSVRLLLVLVLAAALPFGWLAVEMKKATEQKEAVEWIWQLPASVTYDWEIDSDGVILAGARPPEPLWLQKLLGVDFFTGVVHVRLSETEVTNAGLSHLECLTTLHELELMHTHITDAGLKSLGGLNQLQGLLLADTQVTDAGLEYIARLQQLQDVWLEDTRVTAAGVKRLQQALPNCKITY